MLSGDAVDIPAELARRPEVAGDDRRMLENVGALLGHAPRANADAAGLPLGLTIGGFKLVRKLGAGGMGTVYLAEDPATARHVAVKVLRPAVVWSEEVLARFDREARALSRIKHPSIVRSIGFGDERGIRFLAMEYVDGHDLSELLADAEKARAPIPLSRVLHWFAELARALDAAHSAGVIHRDIKPSNIRIAEDGHAVLIDFGLVKADADASLTMTDEFLGSPRYASPEQLGFGRAPVDARSDVYSLGVSLYEAVTGLQPFRGRTPDAVLPQILSGDFETPRRIRGEISRDLEAVILKAIELDPASRYQSAAAFAADLESVIELRTPMAQVLGPLRRFRRWTRRRPTRAALLGGVVIAIAAGAAWYGAVRWRSSRIVASLVSSSLASIESGDVDRATTLLDDALRLDPYDTRALVARDSALQAKRKAAAATLVSAARAARSRFLALRDELATIEATLEALRIDMELRSLTREELDVVERSGGSTRSQRIEAEASFNEATALATRALGLDPECGDARSLLADLYFERWSEATRSGDASAAARWSAQVRDFDREGRHRDRMNRHVDVRFTSDPPGAVVHLFRYREQREIRPAGTRRLIPVPWVPGGAAVRPPTVEPGTTCLRVLNTTQGLAREDIIVEVAGIPVEGAVFAVIHDRSSHEISRVRTIDGEPVIDAWDALLRIQNPRPTGDAHVIAISDGADDREISATDADHCPVDFGNAEAAVLVPGVSAKLWRDGRLEERTLPGNVRAVRTAAPLLVSDDCRVGATPTPIVALDPGSWIAVVSAPGFETQRYPFLVDDESTEIHVTLLPSGSTPAWMQWIPPGRSRLGARSGLGRGQLPDRVRDVPGFWMMVRELVVSDVIPFLNDPSVSGELKAKPRVVLSFGSNAPTMWDRWLQQVDGEWRARPGSEAQPVNAFDLRQARAYANWCTERYAAPNRRRAFGVPTDVEWERAARGVDARDFPYGNTFSPRWQKGGSSRANQMIESYAQFPVDESVFGIYDMAGSMLEPVIPTESWDPAVAGFDATILRGTPWSYRIPRKIWRSTWSEKGVPSVDAGVRLVIRPGS